MGGFTGRYFKTVGCHPHWPKGRVNARPLDSRVFQTCAMHPGHVSGTSVIAAKSHRCAVPSGRVQPAQ